MKRLYTFFLLLALISIPLKSQTKVVLALPNNCNNPSTNVKTVNEQNNLSVFPNPNKGNFTLNINFKSSINNAFILIFDTKGKCLYSEQIYCKSEKLVKKLNLQFLASGVYIVKVKNTQKEVTSKLIIKQ